MRYRIWQGVRALFAWTRPLDLAPAEALLSPALLALFKRMRRSEQLHSLGVLETLRARGHDHPDLLVAGLLHDVGKSRAPIGLVGRTLVVLVRAFLPGRYWQWARGKANGWRRAFVVAEAHPAWGAEMVSEAGASALVVALVRRHQEKIGETGTEEERLLAALQAADAAN
jgi:predicted hydrolase (HD superfamily)